MWNVFTELIRTPFEHLALVWGIVPLYFALLLSELTSSKANYRTAIQTGFSFLWAGAQWLYPWFKAGGPGPPGLRPAMIVPVNLFVTGCVIALGLVALFSGLFHRFPKGASFLGHTRFSNYFMITIFPIQAHYLAWTWDRLLAIVVFAIPVWLVLHFGLMPLRK